MQDRLTHLLMQVECWSPMQHLRPPSRQPAGNETLQVDAIGLQNQEQGEEDGAADSHAERILLLSMCFFSCPGEEACICLPLTSTLDRFNLFFPLHHGKEREYLQTEEKVCTPGAGTGARGSV